MGFSGLASFVGALGVRGLSPPTGVEGLAETAVFSPSAVAVGWAVAVWSWVVEGLGWSEVGDCLGLRPGGLGDLDLSCLRPPHHADSAP